MSKDDESKVIKGPWGEKPEGEPGELRITHDFLDILQAVKGNDKAVSLTISQGEERILRIQVENLLAYDETLPGNGQYNMPFTPETENLEENLRKHDVQQDPQLLEAVKKLVGYARELVAVPINPAQGVTPIYSAPGSKQIVRQSARVVIPAMAERHGTQEYIYTNIFDVVMGFMSQKPPTGPANGTRIR